MVSLDHKHVHYLGPDCIIRLDFSITQSVADDFI